MYYNVPKEAQPCTSSTAISSTLSAQRYSNHFSLEMPETTDGGGRFNFANSNIPGTVKFNCN